MDKEKQLLDLLRRVRPYLSDGPSMMQAIYRSPADSLRMAADSIEEKERLLSEIDRILTK